MKTNDTFVIKEVDTDRKKYLPLLLIGDESERMIDRYIDSGTLYVGSINNEPIAVCIVIGLDSDTVEVKNIAVSAAFRRKGYGRRMLNHIEFLHQNKTIILGTGETPSTLRFYKSCGFSPYRRIPDFFTVNYPRPIIEEGITLRDMIYLRKDNHIIGKNDID